MVETNGTPDATDITPSPDPTRLTTQLVDRAIAAFREVVTTRLEAMDTATQLLAVELVKMHRENASASEHVKEDRQRELAAGREFILSQVENVRSVTIEKFRAIDTQFTERDTRTQQAADESRISLDAALAAAKEAVSEQNKANAAAIGKSEDAIKERLDGLVLLMTTSIKSLEDKIGDLKGRLDSGEGATLGSRDTRTEQRLSTGALVALISVAVAAVAVVVNFIP